MVGRGWHPSFALRFLPGVALSRDGVAKVDHVLTRDVGKSAIAPPCWDVISEHRRVFAPALLALWRVAPCMLLKDRGTSSLARSSALCSAGVFAVDHRCFCFEGGLAGFQHAQGGELTERNSPNPSSFASFSNEAPHPVGSDLQSEAGDLIVAEECRSIFPESGTLNEGLGDVRHSNSRARDYGPRPVIM
jgi:hypothetical protein